MQPPGRQPRPLRRAGTAGKSLAAAGLGLRPARVRAQAPSEAAPPPPFASCCRRPPLAALSGAAGAPHPAPSTHGLQRRTATSAAAASSAGATSSTATRAKRSGGSGSTARGGSGGDDDDFELMLARLRSWVDTYGSCHVPRSVPDARDLSTWVRRMRRAGTIGRGEGLSAQQRAALDALGFVWKPTMADSSWHDLYHAARTWTDANGGGGPLQQLAEAAEARDAALLAARQEAQRAVQRSEREAARQFRQQKLREAGLLPAPEPDAAAADAAALQAAEQAAEEAAAAVATLGPHPLDAADPEARRLVSWLRRQLELYRVLKLTPLKVKLLRRLRLKLRRQKGGPAPEEVHPGLRFADSGGAGASDAGRAPHQRALRVNAATQRGARAAAALSRRLREGADVWAALLDGPRSGSDAAAAAWALDECVFMLALSQLQSWYARYGRGAPVPPTAWDRSQLAEWVAAVRRAHAPQLKAQAHSKQGQQAEQAEQPAGGQAPDQQQAQRAQAEAPSSSAISGAQRLQLWQETELQQAGFRFQAEKPEHATWHAGFHTLRRAKAFRGAELLGGTAHAAGAAPTARQRQRDEPHGQQERRQQQQQESVEEDGASGSTSLSEGEWQQALAWLEAQRRAVAAGTLRPGCARLLAQLLGPRWAG